MNKYVVRLSEKQRELMSRDLILGHVKHLKKLKMKGLLPICGPCNDGTAIMIFQANSIREVEKYLEEDPFSKANYYQKREIVELSEATIENNFLLDDVIEYIENK